MRGLARQVTYVGSQSSEQPSHSQTAEPTAQAQTAAQTAQALHQQTFGLPRQSTHVVRTTDDTTDDTTDNILAHLNWLPRLE